MGAVEDATNYIGQRFGPSYTAWLLLSTDDKSRTMVSATSYIDSLQWQGTPTGLVNGNVTFLQWPRSGIDGVDPLTVPTQIVNATFELAVLIAAAPDLVQNVDSGSNVQSMGAGPASLSFFRPTFAANGSATVLPPLINRMIGQWLAGSGAGLAGALITGINGRSDFGRGSCVCTGACTCSSGVRNVIWPV